MSTGEEDELLAAEYAFGLLDDAGRAEVERRADREPALADMLRRWLDRAAGLAASGTSVLPPAAIWSRIRARLPANTDVGPARATVRTWQAATAIMSAASLIAGIAIGERLRGPAPPAPAPPQLVALLDGHDGRAALVVDLDRAGRRLVAVPARLTVGRHSAELWVITGGGKPVSLGLVDAARPAAIRPPAASLALLGPGVTLALSIEPVGGSPTGQPTGPVIVSGKLIDS